MTDFQFEPLQLFEQPTQKELLTKKREVKLEEFAQIEKRERELQAILRDLNVKKADIAAEARGLRSKVLQLEEIERRNKEEEERLAALKLEAKSLEEYAKRLEELCSDLEAWSSAREYQKEDLLVSLKAYLDGKSGILNANDMSLGKTFEAIMLLYALKKLKPEAKILWLTKSSLTISTPAEIKRWWPDANLITSAVARTPEQRRIVLDMLNMGADFLVANYEFIRVTPEVFNYKFDFLVVDEAHKLKGGANSSGATDIWKATKRLKQNVEFCIFLTGTPMVNKPEEMWAYLNIFDEERFPTLRQFQRTFNMYKSYTEMAGQTERASNLLQGILRGQMFRRTAEEVGLQLPPIQEETVTLEMMPEQRRIYNQMRDFFYVWLDEQEDEALTSTSILAQLIRLRQINVWPDNIVFNQRDENNEITSTQTLNLKESSKIDEAMDIIDRVNDQIVVFSTFNEPLAEIKKRCLELDLSVEVLNGDNSWDVGRIEKEFQQNKTQVLCMNSAVGEGLNLQKDKSKWPGGARYGIMLDKWYSPARNQQCLRRIVRPGSMDKGMFWYLENTDSVDNWLNLLNQMKQESFDSITGSGTLRPKNWKSFLKGKI